MTITIFTSNVCRRKRLSGRILQPFISLNCEEVETRRPSFFRVCVFNTDRKPPSSSRVLSYGETWRPAPNQVLRFDNKLHQNECKLISSPRLLFLNRFLSTYSNASKDRSDSVIETRRLCLKNKREPTSLCGDSVICSVFTYLSGNR